MDLHSEKFVVLYYRFVLDFVQGSLLLYAFRGPYQCGFSYNAVTAAVVMFIEGSVENEGWREARAVHQIFSNYYLLLSVLIKYII